MYVYRFCLIAFLNLAAIAGVHAQSAATEAADAENKKTGKSAEDAIVEAGDAKQNEEMRIQIKNAVWQSQLGQMFSEYLSPNDDPKETNRKAHDLVDRMFSDVKLTIPRSAAVQLMIEDLYEGDHLDKVTTDRIGLFQFILGQSRQQREWSSLKKLLRRAPYFMAWGALAASPLIHEQTALAAKWASYKAAKAVGFNVEKNLADVTGSMRFRELGTRAVFNGYNLDRGYYAFLKWFSFYSAYYFMFQSGSTDNVPIVARVGIIGLEQSMKLRQL